MKNINRDFDNIIPFNNQINLRKIKESLTTPISDEIIKKAKRLISESNYACTFDFEVYRKLELRFKDKNFPGGITFKSPIRFANADLSFLKCHYAFEIDTYGRGCVHDCVYCKIKAEFTGNGFWNNPMPAPVDITEIWRVFQEVFESDKNSKWREIFEKKIPIKIGSMSDSFMFMDQKYKVTQELLKILDFYKYPYIIFTRSDLVAYDEYVALLNPNLCSIQMSISSTNEEMNKLIEPGAPSAKRRLKAMQKLTRNGFWTTVRLNPFFPIYADGYFTDPNFNHETMPEPFFCSSFEMIDEIASYGIPSVLAGMVRLSSFALNKLEKALGRDLHALYCQETKKQSIFVESTNKKSRDFHYSDKEIRAYYERIHAKCKQNAIQFTTCYRNPFLERPRPLVEQKRLL